MTQPIHCHDCLTPLSEVGTPTRPPAWYEELLCNLRTRRQNLTIYFCEPCGRARYGDPAVEWPHEILAAIKAHQPLAPQLCAA